MSTQAEPEPIVEEEVSVTGSQVFTFLHGLFTSSAVFVSAVFAIEFF